MLANILKVKNISDPAEKDFNSVAREDGELSLEEWMAWTGIIFEDHIIM